MLKFNHRHSKDIDIFFPDRQFLGCVSPRVNDAIEVEKFNERENGIKLFLPEDEGEIDFVAAFPVTPIKPSLQIVAGISSYVEDPVEIVAKKLVYRTDYFKPRDVFDLAVVYDSIPSEMLKAAPFIAPKLEALENRFNIIDSSGELEPRLQEIILFDGGQKVRGLEMEICRQYLKDISQHMKQTSEEALKTDGLGARTKFPNG